MTLNGVWELCTVDAVPEPPEAARGEVKRSNRRTKRIIGAGGNAHSSCGCRQKNSFRLLAIPEEEEEDASEDGAGYCVTSTEGEDAEVDVDYPMLDVEACGMNGVPGD